MGKNPGVINSGSVVFDQITTVLLSTTMFTAGVAGFFLDNTVPGNDLRLYITFLYDISIKILFLNIGTREERGLTKWLTHETNETNEVDNYKKSECTYDIPFITPWLKG